MDKGANPDAFQLSGAKSVTIYKSDESIQCERLGIAPEVMKVQLTEAGIKVMCAQKGDSGLSVLAMCGAPTTAINIYVIRVSDWPKAEKLGFKQIEELSEYTGRGCESMFKER